MMDFKKLVKEFDKIGYDLRFGNWEYGRGYYWEGGGRYGFEPSTPQIINRLEELKIEEANNEY